MITSNHQALYTQTLAVAVLYQLSIKVPNPIATAKTINKTAVKRVENKILLSTSFMVRAASLFPTAKIRYFTEKKGALTCLRTFNPDYINRKSILKYL